jgi:hypothetical protein
MKTLLKFIYYYFSNLNNYLWADNNRILVILETTWFSGWTIYPLVTYCYLDEIDRYGNKPTNMFCLNRSDFIMNMHVLNNDKNIDKM